VCPSSSPEHAFEQRDEHAARTPFAAQPRGLKLIVLYKCIKAPLVLALALVLSFDRSAALRVIEHVMHDLSEGGALAARVAHWIEAHLTGRTLGRGAIVAWLDGITTSLEAFLLWRGRAWGEWLVVVGIGALIPFELFSLEHHRTWLRLGALVINAVIVGYLVRLRLRERHGAKRERH
jgi:uncharacterized membrane protein (DUF2068 family)